MRVELLADGRVHAIARDRQPSLCRRECLPGYRVLQQHARAVLVLLDPDACAIEFDPVRAETRACSLIQQHLQSAAMDAHFGKLVAGRLAARLAIDQLPEAIVEAALPIFDSGGEQFFLQAKRGEFPHAMRQQREADAKLLHLGRAFENAAGNAAFVQIKCQGEPANPGADNEDLVHRHGLSDRSR